MALISDFISNTYQIKKFACAAAHFYSFFVKFIENCIRKVRTDVDTKSEEAKSRHYLHGVDSARSNYVSKL